MEREVRALAQAQEEYERQSRPTGSWPDDEQRKRIIGLTTDFPRLWNDPKPLTDASAWRDCSSRRNPDQERENLIATALPRRHHDDLTLPRPKSGWDSGKHRRKPSRRLIACSTITPPAASPHSERTRIPAGMGGAFNCHMVRTITHGYHCEAATIGCAAECSRRTKWLYLASTQAQSVSGAVTVSCAGCHLRQLHKDYLYGPRRERPLPATHSLRPGSS